MNRSSLLSSKRIGALMGVCLVLTAMMVFDPAGATQLPPSVRNYVLQKDPQAKIRFDGLVTLSNGQSYLPVIPQGHQVPDPVQVIYTYPQGVDSPDLVQFDNDYYLLRLLTTDKGRLTLPKLPEYPLGLLEGLLPQDLVLPPNLFIPVELKVLLGALPYNPESGQPVDVQPVKPTQGAGKLQSTAVGNPAVSVKNTQAGTGTSQPLQMQSATSKPKTLQEMLFVYNTNNHRLLTLDPLNKRQQGSINLGCVPSRIKASGDGRLLFVTCLTTDELLVLDTSANLIKTRMQVGSKPDDVLLLNQGEETAEVLISHRFSKFVSLVNARELLEPREMALPGAGGAMAALPGKEADVVLVADAFGGKVYRLNLRQQVVDKTYDTLPDIAALRVLGTELWLASRSKNQVQVLDLLSGAVLNTFDVGKKPVNLLVVGDRLYVLSAQSDRLDVLDWKAKQQKPAIQLVAGTFPAGMVSADGGSRVYILGAGTDGVTLVDLTQGQVEDRLDLPVRGSLIILAGGVMGGESPAVQSEPVKAALEMEAVSLDSTATTSSNNPPAPVTEVPSRNANRRNAAEKVQQSLFPALPSLQENVLK